MPKQEIRHDREWNEWREKTFPPLEYKKPIDVIKHDTMCLLPFTHFYYAPGGNIAGCCVNLPDGMNSKTRDTEFIKLVNLDSMKSLRKALISGKAHSSCENCWVSEDMGNGSFRTGHNMEWYDWYEDDIADALDTYNNETGELKEFKMRYMDIRFSNLCNMKCRYCSAGFSSQWEAENIKNNTPEWIGGPIPLTVSDGMQDQLMMEIIKQIPHLRVINLAGGEPLIEQRNYVILDEIIKQGRAKHIEVKISTNGSTVKFKDWDVVEMLSQFKKVHFNISIDHSGERAEYMRSGTKWPQLIANLKQFRRMGNGVRVNIAVSVSAFNYVSFDECFYELHKEGIINNTMTLSVNPITMPSFMSPPGVLNNTLKEEGANRWRELIQYCKDNDLTDTPEWYQDLPGGNDVSVLKFDQIENMLTWVTSTSYDEDQVTRFQEHCRHLDDVRKESFNKTFPELAEMHYV